MTFLEMGVERYREHAHRAAALGRRAALSAVALPLSALLACCGAWGRQDSACIPVDEAPPHPAGNDTADSAPSKRTRLSARGLALSPDGSLLAAGESIDWRLLGLSSSWGTTLWNTADGRVVRRFGNEMADALAWHPGGELIAVGGGDLIEITDLAGTVQMRLTGHGHSGAGSGMILDLAFTSDGSLLASLSNDGTVRLWEIGADVCAPGKILDVRRLSATALSFSPDGGELVIVGPDGPPQRWDPLTGRRLERIRKIEGQPYGVTHLPDGTVVVGTAEPTQIQSVGPSAFADAPPPPSVRPLHLAVAEDGRLAVGGQFDNQVMIWDPSNGEHAELPLVAGSVEQLAWSPDSTVLYGVSPIDGVVAWDGAQWTALELPAAE